MKNPEQPPSSSWKFVEELQKPLHDRIHLARTTPEDNEADLSGGVSCEFAFPDTESVLETAYDDFKRFLKSARIKDGGYKITLEKSPSECFEAYKIDLGIDACVIKADDTEGIRRGLIYLEDEILRAGGQFLPLGTISRKPLIKTRISRCFFGPIKRPPVNRDELTDNVNYYPDEYLNRLAHEGINALWLTVSFQELCPSRFFPEHGKDGKRRIEKLTRTVKQCARYGIKIYVFCIEPIGFGDYHQMLPPESLKNNPQFKGNGIYGNSNFCTSSQDAKDYMEESAYYLFSSVPGLGGLIDINLGERPTHCYSSVIKLVDNSCPRCSKRKPEDVFTEVLTAISKGMHRAVPEAEMVSWLYVPHLNDNVEPGIEETQDIIKAIAANVPDSVTLQYNFESTGMVEQLGKERIALDYFLSWPGPSDIFKDCAQNALKNGARVSAKIQVGCSHEVATIPFVPVPGMLYKKYWEMRKLGVSTVMQCWYFGNYPGLMNKAAGELSFDPLPANEDEFLLELARIDWDKNASKVVKAWNCFNDAYSNFPVNLGFTHYGPLHHSIVWPLHMFPVDKPIAPSWKFTFPLDSGDRIGECICYEHTLDEILILLKMMSEKWEEGIREFNEIELEYVNNRERKLDISLAKALSLQIKSSYNVMKFYSLRENLPYTEISERLNALEEMKEIILEEIENSNQLKKLCLEDSRLGFHSEAEGYKYFPEKLEWRIEGLRNLLDTEYPNLKKIIEENEKVFPEYTGAKPEGKSYICPKNESDAIWESMDGDDCEWMAFNDEKSMFFKVKCPMESVNTPLDDKFTIIIEPCRLWPVQKFSISCDGSKGLENQRVFKDERWDAGIEKNDSEWVASFKIPLACFEGYHRKNSPLRINVLHQISETTLSSWIKENQFEYRLRFGRDNPEDLAWLFLSL